MVDEIADSGMFDHGFGELKAPTLDRLLHSLIDVFLQQLQQAIVCAEAGDISKD